MCWKAETSVCWQRSYSQGYGLPSGHVWLWELEHKEGRMSKNWCLCTAVLEKTPESPLDSKKIKPVNLKGNQPWILIGRTDAEAPVFWLSDANSWLYGEVPDARKNWGQKEKRVSGDEIAGLHHWCNGHELGQTLGDAEGQGGLACCSPWDHKESSRTGQLNNNNNMILISKVIYSILQNLCFHMAFCVSIYQKSKAIYRVYIFNNDTEKYFASYYYSIWAS